MISFSKLKAEVEYKEAMGKAKVAKEVELFQAWLIELDKRVIPLHPKSSEAKRVQLKDFAKSTRVGCVRANVECDFCKTELLIVLYSASRPKVFGCYGCGFEADFDATDVIFQAGDYISLILEENEPCYLLQGRNVNKDIDSIIKVLALILNELSPLAKKRVSNQMVLELKGSLDPLNPFLFRDGSSRIRVKREGDSLMIKISGLLDEDLNVPSLWDHIIDDEEGTSTESPTVVEFEKCSCGKDKRRGKVGCPTCLNDRIFKSWFKEDSSDTCG